MADSTVISGVSDLPRFYFAQGAKMRLTLNVGAEFPLAGKFAEFGIRARSGKVRRIFRTDSDESNLSITSQVVSVDIDPADETVPAFSGGWTLADVQALAETEYWVDFSDTEGGPVLLRLQGQANWVSAGDDIEESAAVVAAPEIDVAISSGSVTVTVAVTGGEVGIPVGGTTGQVLSKASGSDYDTEWITASGLGTVTSVAVSGSDGIQVDSGSPITSSGTIALGVDAAALRSHINVEDGADVTDNTNVTAAGALMDSEVSSLSGIKTLTVPDNTTISAFGASLVDDADAATARATLGVDAAGTDNSTDVTLAGTPDYITISGQVITRNAVNLADDITGTLPVGNGGTGVTSLGSLDAADLGSGASTDGYVLTSDGLGGSAWEASTGGGGTVSSVAVSGTDGIEVDSGSPITSSGTITLGVNAATLSSHLGLGTAATSNTGDFEAAGAVSSHAAVTSGVHGISTFGASLVDDTDAATARTTLGLGTASTSATGDFEAAGAVSTHAAVTSGVHGISTFGATLVDDADAATARTTLGVDAAGTDNSVPVTLAGTPDYITISGQVITRNAVDLAADITGTLPVANGGTGVTALSSIDASDLGSGAGTDGYVLTADGAGGAAWEAAAGGGLTQFTETLHTASPNDTVNAAQLEVTSGSTNADLVLTPKGTGAFIVGPEPDGTSIGGNKRGASAIDIQTQRISADQVASGTEVTLIGIRCKHAGINGFVAGYNSSASSGNYYPVVIGTSVYSGGSGAVVIGSDFSSATASATAIGSANSANAYVSAALGRYAVASLQGFFAWSGGSFSAAGDRQVLIGQASIKTTDATPTELLCQVIFGNARITIPSGKIYNFQVQIVGAKSDGSAVARYLRQATIKNVSGTTSLVGSVIAIGTDEAAGTSIAITADDTNDALAITVTGISSETWRWHATIIGSELAYGT